MIVFQPIGYRDYKRHLEVNFKSIHIDLIKQGDMRIYLDDKEAHKVAKLESFKNQEWDYVAFVIQYCLEDEFMKCLMELSNIDTRDFFNKRPLFVPPKVEIKLILH